MVNDCYIARFTRKVIKVTKVISPMIVLAVSIRDEFGKLVNDGKEYPFNLDYFDLVEETNE